MNAKSVVLSMEKFIVSSSQIRSNTSLIIFSHMGNSLANLEIVSKSSNQRGIMLDFRFVILLLLLTHSSTSLPTNFFGAIRVIQHVCYNEISSGHVIEIVRIAYDFTLGIS